MNSTKRFATGLCHRLAYAATFSGAVWILSTMPLSHSLGGPVFWLTRVVDAPIATASLLLPCNERGVDLWYRVGAGSSPCPHEVAPDVAFFNHMRIGLLAYVLLFYVPAIYRAGRGRWQRRRGRATAQSVIAAKT